MTVRKIGLDKYLLFAHLSRDELHLFEKYIRYKTYDKGSVIISEGEVGDSIFMLEEGEVEITQALTLPTRESNYDTREKSIIRLKHDSYPFFGEMSLFGNETRRNATVTALTNCKMAIISNKDLLKVCDKNPEIGYQVMKNIATVLSERLRQCNQNVLKLTTAFSLILEE